MASVNKISRFSLIVAFMIALLPILVPGHLRIHFGWLVSYIGYGLVYVLIGCQYSIFSVRTKLYTITIFIAYILLPINTFISDADYWYPYLTPLYSLVGAIGFTIGYLYYHTVLRTYAYLTIIMLLLIESAIGLYIDQLTLSSTINQQKFENVLNIKPKIDFITLNGMRLPERYYEGKLAFIDFGFLECTACNDKHIAFDNMAKLYPDTSQYLFLYVVNGKINKLADVRAKFAKGHYAFTVLYDSDGNFERKYLGDNRSYPIEIRLNKEGNIYETINGYSVTSAQYVNQAQTALSHQLENE
ncbi:hypothetical protein [Mucilaginibacter sp.]